MKHSSLFPVATNLINPPKQARSRERLQRVLEAADRVLADEGAEALTTTRVAEVAEVAVGSVYRFFPDREAIAEALALSYWEEFGDLVAGLAESFEPEPDSDPAARMIDTLAGAFRASPGFRALWFGGLRTERLRDATRPLRTRFSDTVEGMLASAYPEAKPKLRAATARMLVLTGDALLREAFRRDPDGDEELLSELKLLLNSYLDARMGARARVRRRGS